MISFNEEWKSASLAGALPLSIFSTEFLMNQILSAVSEVTSKTSLDGGGRFHEISRTCLRNIQKEMNHEITRNDTKQI
jgi:hypothetical protein